jgi:REP element-mobilizing transposase RayT
MPQGHTTVYNFFTAPGKQHHTVSAYVIMPNHLHLLLHYSGGKSLNTVPFPMSLLQQQLQIIGKTVEGLVA